MKRFLIGCLALLLVFSSWPAIGMAASQFSDIKGHFAEKEILQLYEQGVISGYKDGRFYPNRQVTRAEFLRMLLETVPVKEWIKGPVPFEQLSKHWAYHYLENSYRSGLLLEMEWKLVDPKLEEKMTRAEAALLLAATMDLKASTTIVNPFKDLDKSLEKVTEAILALNQIGIIRGMTDDTYGPDQQLTRGQVSKILILVQQFKERQLEQRLNPQAVLEEVKGDVKVVTAQGTRAGKVGEVLAVGTEIQTGAQSSATLKISDGDTLYIDANSRLTIQELDIALQDDKSRQVQAQQFKIVEQAILLRGKADEKNIGLNWQTDKKVNDYSIFKARNETVDPSRKPTVKGSKSTKWLDTDIEPGHTYHYQVVGATGPNEGLGSKEISFEVVKKASFKLWSGNVLAKVKSLFSPSSKFEVQTPTTTAGVRGTTFSVSVQQDGTSNIGVYSGSVALGGSNDSSINGQAEVTLQSLQQATVAKPGNEPDVKGLKVSETSSFIQESLAKVIVQEKQEQQQVQDKLKELEKKLQEKLGDLNDQMIVSPPKESDIEVQINMEDRVDLYNVYDTYQKQIDEIINRLNNTKDKQTKDIDGSTDSATSSPTIASIPLQYHRVGQGHSFSLPTTVPAKMSDGTTSKVNVTWYPSKADTSKAGVYTFTATVSGHTATFKLAVEAPLGTPVAVETNKPLAFAGGITLDLGAFTDTGVKVSVKKVPLADVNGSPSGLLVGGEIVDFQFYDENDVPISMNKTAKISLPVNSTDASQSAVYYYDEGNDTWIYQPTVYENGLLYADVTHFSIYGVLKDTTIPANLIVEEHSKTSNSVTLKMSAYDASGIKKYFIYRDGVLIAETDSNDLNPYYTDETVQSGYTYTYSITAKDNLNNESGHSESIQVSVPTGSSTTGQLTFQIKIPELTAYENDARVNMSYRKIYSSPSDYAYYMASAVTQSVTTSSDGMGLHISNVDWGVTDKYYVSISTNGYIFNTEVTEAEGTSGTPISLTADTSFIPTQVDIANTDSTVLVDQIGLSWLDETGKSILTNFTEQNGKVKAGSYYIQVQAQDDTHGYALFKDNVAISSSQNTITFSENEFSEITFNLTDTTNTSLKPSHVVAFPVDHMPNIYYSTHMNGLNKIYVSNLAYSNMYLDYKSDDGWNIEYRVPNQHISGSTTVNLDTNLKVEVNWLSGQTHNTIQPDKPFINYFNSKVMDSRGNEVFIFDDYHNQGIVNGKITITQGAVSYNKIVEGIEFDHITINDIQPDLTGLVDITFSVEGTPISITPVTVQAFVGSDVNGPTVTSYQLSSTSSLRINQQDQNTYYVTENGGEYAANSIGALTFTFNKPIRKNSIDDIDLYLNGAVGVTNSFIKNMLFAEFNAGSANQLATTDISRTYSELKQVMINTNNGEDLTSLRFVVRDLAGNQENIDLYFE